LQSIKNGLIFPGYWLKIGITYSFIRFLKSTM